MNNPPPVHPLETAQKKRRPKLVTAIIIVLAAVGLFFLGRMTVGAPKAKAPVKTVPVTTARAQKGDIGVTVNALGTVTSPNTVIIKTQVNGKLLSVNYKEGQVVKKGDVLAEIDPQPFQAQLTQAQGQLERDKALLEGARVDLKRYQDAAAQNAIPKQQLDDQVALVHQDEGSVKLDQGQVDNAAVQLAYCHIVSPIDGRVGLRLVDAGNIVQTSDTTGLLVITQTQPITVIFSVAEDFLPQILEQSNKGVLSVDAYDREQSKKITTGSLLAIDNQIDPTTGTIRLRAQFENTDNALFPNQFVNATLLIQTLHDQTLVPTAAIQRNGGNTFVYTVGSDQTAAMKKVTTGVTDSKVIAVEGIDPGDIVVVDGFDKMQNGVKIAEAKAGDSDSAAPSTPDDGKAKKGKSKKSKSHDSNATND